jgi:cysteine desulfurase
MFFARWVSKCILLDALGCSCLVVGAAEDMAHSSLRFGIGRFTTEAEIDFVIGKIVTTVQRLRDMSPLWEMVQEGIDINTINWAQH